MRLPLGPRPQEIGSQTGSGHPGRHGPQPPATAR